MKKIIVVALCMALSLTILVGCTGNENTGSSGTGSTPGNTNQTSGNTPEKISGTVKTGGSTSVEKVMNSLIYQFQDDNREVTVNYEMNGSGDGIKNTISGLYEIGHSSRELKTDGTEDGLEAKPYAIDGIALVVNKNNGITNLTKAQIYDIYTGKIKNWKEVGGKDALVTVVTREPGSGTRSAFAEIVGLEKKDDAKTKIIASATTSDNTGAVQTTVSQNPNAIGYMSFSDVNADKVKPLQYEGVDISQETLKDGTYTLKRDFYLVTKKGSALTPAATAFIEFVLSDEGQKIVSNNKLIPIQ